MQQVAKPPVTTVQLPLKLVDRKRHKFEHDAAVCVNSALYLCKNKAFDMLQLAAVNSSITHAVVTVLRPMAGIEGMPCAFD